MQPGLHRDVPLRVYDCQIRACYASHLPGDLHLVDVRCRPCAASICHFGLASDNVGRVSPHRVVTRQLQPNCQPCKLCLCLPKPCFGYWTPVGFTSLVLYSPYHPTCDYWGYIGVKHGEFSLLHACRVGEASNPGPWGLQLRNVVSANKHADELDSNHFCTAWTETSANSATLSKLHKKARFLKGYLNTSAPWNNRRPEQSSGGRSTAAGTLLFSRQHAKSLHQLWDMATWQSARVSDSLIQLDGVQVRVIVVYGVHSGVQGSLEQNELLFGEIFRMIGSTHIPTLLVGDFNCDINRLGCWQCAVNRGFVDVGAKTAAMANQPPQHTYKGISRLDYVVCCPLAFRALESFSVDPNGFTDHAILRVQFSWDVLKTRIPKWNLPCDMAKLCDSQPHFQEVPIAEAYQSQFYDQINKGETTAAFHYFVQGFEEKMRRVYEQIYGSKLPPKFLGRCKGKISYVHPASLSAHPTERLLTDRIHINARARAISRLRHLHHLLLKNCEPSQCASLWCKLLRDKSFSPNFATWLIEQDFCAVVPGSTPTVQWLDGIMPAVLHDFSLMQDVVEREQRAAANRRFEHDWKKGGRLHTASLKPEPPARLDSLLKDTHLSIRPLRVQKGNFAKFRVMEPQRVQLGAKWCFGNISASVSRIEQDVVTLDAPMQIQMYKKTVVQKAWCTDPNWLFVQLRDFWSSFWNHSRPIDLATTRYLVDALPELTPFEPQVTVDDVITAIRQLKVGKARGLDGFSNFELQCFHRQDAQMLAAFFNSVMATGQWPDEMCDGVVTLIAKIEQPQSPKDGRPITILSTIFRLFGKIFSQKILHHYLPHLPQSLYGSIPGRSSTDAAWHLASQIEEAMASNNPLYGVSLDLSKAYNLLPRQVLMQMAIKTGWPPALVHVYHTFLGKLRRYFKLADGLWGPVSSTVGVPEGCPLAVSCMVLITWAVSARVDSLGVPLISYVDNWSAQMCEQQHVATFLHEIVTATNAMQLILNTDKTRAYSTCPEGRNFLRKIQFQGGPLQICLRLDDLGVDFNSSKKPAAAAFLTRVEAVQPRLARLQRTPWTHTRKAQVLFAFCPPGTFIWG